MGKSVFTSKTFWVNMIAIAVMIINHFYPLFSLSVELESIILGVINIILRMITGQPIVWDSKNRKPV